jgi:hypothetical protein
MPAIEHCQLKGHSRLVVQTRLTTVQGFYGYFEQHALLGIHRLGFIAGDVEELE